MALAFTAERLMIGTFGRGGIIAFRCVTTGNPTQPSDCTNRLVGPSKYHQTKPKVMNMKKGLSEEEHDRGGKEIRRGEKSQCGIYIYVKNCQRAKLKGEKTYMFCF